jgi:hypothetical protein
VNIVTQYRLVKRFHSSLRLRKSHPPRIFSEARHGTEASRALILGAERNRQFARHLNRLLSEASLDPSELAALLGRTEVLISKCLQGVHLPRLGDLPEIVVALNLKSCRDLIHQEWCTPER